jgi:nitrogen-specific signal transduction histidine kinase
VSAVPQTALRAQVFGVARRLEAGGDGLNAGELREALETWEREHRGWMAELARQLGLHHDINNALVGVRGNVQLLLMGPAAQAPGARDRLEVVLRESDRIREAATRLNALKTALTVLVRESESADTSRAA